MSTTYKVITDDTFESISRKQYGSENAALDIKKANPGVVEPLTPGINIIIPVLPGTPKDVSQTTAAADIDEVAILIDGKRFRFWDKVSISKTIDGIDTVEFSAPFDADAPGFKQAFRPFSFQDITITVGGEPLFTGTMVNPVPVIESDKKIISVSCYALPGVLNDCTAPASAFPLEFNDQNLKEIATALAKPFGVGVKFLADHGPVFEQVLCAEGKKILSFLTDLAKQRNLIISSNAQGELIFLKSDDAGQPVAILEQGTSPLMGVSPTFNPQNYHSHITGIESAIVGLAGSQFTVKNKHLSDVVRPLSFSAPDTEDGNVKTAVEAKMGRMFGNMVSYNVPVATWRDVSGVLWRPNTTIKLKAPDAMIYEFYEFIIRSVEFTADSSSRVASLKIVLPGAFSGEIPESLPWD